jgi:hypothetical protein
VLRASATAKGDQRTGRGLALTIGADTLAARAVLGTKHHAIVDDIAQRLKGAPFNIADVALVVDRTGVGEGVVEAFELAGLSPIGVFISAGQVVHEDQASKTYSVPKKDLADAVRIPLEERRLQFAEDLQELQVLKKELQVFTGKINERGHDSYAAMGTAHDDMVLATALACWYATTSAAMGTWGWGMSPTSGYRG